MREVMRLMKSAMVETLYPKVCPGCGQRGAWLCEWCDAQVPRMDDRICDRCGSPSERHCISCADLDPLIAQARSAYPYTGWVTGAIRRFKYDAEFSRSDHLGERLAETLRLFDRVDALVPVPLHRSRLHARGYNQSALLAARASELLGVPVQPLVRRQRATTPQVSLRESERRSNVEGAFEIDPSWSASPDRVYVLIDDVRTTGATLGACARAIAAETTPKTPTILAATLALDVRRDQLDPWLAAMLKDRCGAE